MVISVAGFLSQALVILYGLAIGVVDLDLDFSISGGDIGRVLLIVLIIVAAAGLVFWSSQRLRRWFADKVKPQVHEFRTGLTAATSSPKRLLLLFGGDIGSQVLYGAVMAGCLHAYGACGSLLVLGVDATTATVAVLTHRMLTYYLPPLYGYLGFTWLKNRDYL